VAVIAYTNTNLTETLIARTWNASTSFATSFQNAVRP
jgi:hypothetical protein